MELKGRIESQVEPCSLDGETLLGLDGNGTLGVKWVLQVESCSLGGET